MTDIADVARGERQGEQGRRGRRRQGAARWPRKGRGRQRSRGGRGFRCGTPQRDSGDGGRRKNRVHHAHRHGDAEGPAPIRSSPTRVLGGRPDRAATRPRWSPHSAGPATRGQSKVVCQALFSETPAFTQTQLSRHLGISPLSRGRPVRGVPGLSRLSPADVCTIRPQFLAHRQDAPEARGQVHHHQGVPRPQACRRGRQEPALGEQPNAGIPVPGW